MKTNLREGKNIEFLELLRTFIADVPTFETQDKVTEKFFEHTLYLIFRTLGLDIRYQKSTSFSRMNLTMETAKYLYIFELKLDVSVEKALHQIKEKEYPLPYSQSHKTIICFGINFSSHPQNITAWDI